MRVRVRLFAAARAVVGQGEVSVEVEDGSTVGDFMDLFFARHPELAGMAGSLLLAVNREFADQSVGLKDGDELGVMPPVSGGRGA